MGNVVVWMQQSADGYVHGPERSFDWPLMEPETQAYGCDVLRKAGAFLYGRTVWQMMSGFWPTADVGDVHAEQADYARIWRPMKKYVFSRSLQTDDWNATVISDDLAERVTALKAETDGDLVLFGGGEILAEFNRLDLVDEYSIFVHPVVLGGGAPMFAGVTERRALNLLESRTFPPGVVYQRYAGANRVENPSAAPTE